MRVCYDSWRSGRAVWLAGDARARRNDRRLSRGYKPAREGDTDFLFLWRHPMTREAERTIRLLICDDQAIVCEGLRAILEGVRDIEVVGVATNGVDAIELTRTTQPDLVLMDLKMPRMNGIQATRAICEQFPDVRILVLTTYDEDDWVIDAIRAGAAGYVLKDTPQEDLLKAIRETMMGWSHIDPQAAGKILKYVADQGDRELGDRKVI